MARSCGVTALGAGVYPNALIIASAVRHTDQGFWPVINLPSVTMLSKYSGAAKKRALRRFNSLSSKKGILLLQKALERALPHW